MPDKFDRAPHPLRALPAIQKLLEAPEAAPLFAVASPAAVTATLRLVLARLRTKSHQTPAALPTIAAIVMEAAGLLDAQKTMILRRTINATGIILHTNLGRAPLGEDAQKAAIAVMQGYANLEYDLHTGQRGSRTQGIEPVLCRLLGAEAAVAVNNNAAAMLLALSAHAAGGEVLVSRGELVEIGGGFRIPDIIRQGGARLVEVGTTNKTRLADYRSAITPDTRVLLKVHQSNFRMVGFTAAAAAAELAELAHEFGLLLIEDLGSGTLVDLRPFGRSHEPTVGDSLAAGADLVAFSGDKLLGGPQSGLLVGRAVAVAPLRGHPLMRALRLDKITLAALEATLRQYLDPSRATAAIPVLRMLVQDAAVLRQRAEQLGRMIGVGDDAIVTRVVDSDGYAGGGSLPGETIPSVAVTIGIAGMSGETVAETLRAGAPAVICRVHHGAALCDMLTVADEELPELAACLRQVARAAS